MAEIETGNDSFENYAEKVKKDHHAHRIAHILISVWAGWAWGWLWGLGLFVGLFAVIALSNAVILNTSGSLGLIRTNRWFWLLLALLLILISTASIQQVS